MTMLKKALPIALLASMLAGHSAWATPIIETTGQNLRRLASVTNAPLVRGQTNDTNWRVGSIEATPRHAITTVAFDLGSGATTNKAAYNSAPEIQFTFYVSNIANAASSLPDLNIYYMGTYANPFSSTTIWPDGGTGINTNLIEAQWTGVVSYNTSPLGSFTVSTTNDNFLGSINITTNSSQYAIFVLQVNDPNYLSAGTARNYVLGSASQFVLTAVPEPSTLSLIGLAAVAVAMRRRMSRT